MSNKTRRLAKPAAHAAGKKQPSKQRALAEKALAIPTAPARKPVVIPVIPNSAKVVSAHQVRNRLGGVSEMFLWRLLNGHPELKFPRPFKINKRNFFDLVLVDKWIAAQQVSAKKAA